MRVARFFAFAGFCCLLAACVALAPGADKVRITKVATEVATCTAVGNISVPGNAQGQVDMGNAETQFRNQTVGLGGNAAFVTSAPLGFPVEGVAYRCP
jgi:hypothetical protein